MVQINSSIGALPLLLLTVNLPTAFSLCATVDQGTTEASERTGKDLGHMNMNMGKQMLDSGVTMPSGMYQPVRMFKGNHYPTLEEILNPTPDSYLKSVKDEKVHEDKVGEHFESY